MRAHYASAALAEIPRLLGAMDRNPFRATYGCLDRQFWHYRTSDFPSEMYQEGVLPLALIASLPFAGNRWHGLDRVRELAIAGLKFAARSSHRDGSCDDYYPFERALGAAVFSLAAAAEAYRLLELDDPELRTWFARRANWVIDNDESGRLANHHALAALSLERVARLLGEDRFSQAAEVRARRVLDWQSEEGWFDEYGGADPGYQTVTIDCLAKYRRLTGGDWLSEPLDRAVGFARLFVHPDDSYGGEYGSRGTYHFYPHGMELLAAENDQAGELAEAFLRSLSTGRQAWYDDDRMVAHRLGNLIEAYRDWNHPPVVPVCRTGPPVGRICNPAIEALEIVPWPDCKGPAETERLRRGERSRPAGGTYFLPKAGLVVAEAAEQKTVVSLARGGVFKHFSAEPSSPCSDAGLILETADGRTAVSQMHDRTRQVEFSTPGVADAASVGADAGSIRHGEMAWGSATWSVSGPMHWARGETATPFKLVLFRLALLFVGRWCRTLTRRLLQRRLITGRRVAPIHWKRTVTFLPNANSGPHAAADDGTYTLRVVDTVELLDARVRVRRMSFGSDHQSVYVAASGVYQDSVLCPWTDLTAHVDALNTNRRVTMTRDL